MEGNERDEKINVISLIKNSFTGLEKNTTRV
jgi:hypothetical protein